MAIAVPGTEKTGPLVKPNDRPVELQPDPDLKQFIAECRATRNAILGAESRP